MMFLFATADFLGPVIRGLSLSLGALAGLLLVPCLTLLAETLAAALRPPQPQSVRSALPDSVTVAVLVPAHNEEAGIQQTLESIAEGLRPQDKLLVVADNCSDNTAPLARATGAVVIERFNQEQRGKGYALDHGLSHLRTAPPDIVVFVDADCNIAPNSLPRLAQMALVTGRPVQANYLIEQPAQQSLKGAVSAFAVRVKNFVRPLGLRRLGAPCLLTGTGIALPWASAVAVNIASSHIVEDMKWGLDLAIHGHPPIFLPEALVTSRLPDADQAAKVQRTRWEHGHLQMLTSYTPKLLWQGLRQGSPNLLALALELSILPLSLLVMVWTGVTAILLGLALVGGYLWPLQVAGVAGVALFVGVFLAWVRYGQSDLKLSQLLMVPVYILWKIPLYVLYLLRPQQQWVRTQRDSAK